MKELYKGWVIILNEDRKHLGSERIVRIIGHHAVDKKGIIEYIHGWDNPGKNDIIYKDSDLQSSYLYVDETDGLMMNKYVYESPLFQAIYGSDK